MQIGRDIVIVLLSGTASGDISAIQGRKFQPAGGGSQAKRGCRGMLTTEEAGEKWAQRRL